MNGTRVGPTCRTLRGTVVPVLLLALGQAAPAWAYRPFNSTDADVAAAGELEIELGPVGLVRLRAGEDLLVAPAVIVNLGLLPRLELVVEGQHLYDLEDRAGVDRFRLVDNALFLKGVVRPGALQGASGASVAAEAGVLLPNINDEPGWGLEALAVVSLAADAGMVHINGIVAWTRAHEGELGLGLILEGPAAWAVRPVIEGRYERTLDSEALSSALVGAIWEPTDHLAFDAGCRVFDGGGLRGLELRLGLTWKTQLWNGR
jgi:hypothetical protein